MRNEAKIIVSAQDRATSVLSKISGEIGRMQGAVGRVLGVLGPFGTALTGFVSLGGAAAALRNFVGSVDDLAEAAEGVGVTAVALAELRSKAAEAGVDANKLDFALAKLNKQVVDAAGGNERAAATFKSMGISIKDANGNIRSTEQILAEVADRFSTYANTAEKSALAARLFGEEAGRKLVAYLSQGSQGLRQFTGLTDDTVKSAAKLQSEIDKLSTSFERFKNVTLGAVVPALNDMIFTFKQLDFSKIAAAFNTFPLGNFGGALREYGRQLDDIRSKEIERNRILRDYSATYDEVDRLLRRAPGQRAPDDKQPAKAAQAWKEAKRAVDDYAASIRRALVSERDRRGVDEKKALADAEARRVDELDKLSELEGALTSRQKERIAVFQELREAGRITDEGYVRLMEDLLGKTQEVTAETEKMTDAAKDFGFIFSSALEDIVVKGGSARDVIRSLEQDIIRMVTRLLVTEPLGNSISGAFGRGASTLAGGGSFFDAFADAFIKMFGMSSGGPVAAGRPYLVGEAGPELFVSSQPGQIVPNSRMGGANITINIAGGASRETANQIASAVSRQLAIANARAFV